MSKTNKTEARLPRGFIDRGPAEIAALNEMMKIIREVYERYGFDPVETPLFEYTDAWESSCRSGPAQCRCLLAAG